MSTGIMDTSGIFHETLVRPSSTVANSLKSFAPDGFPAHSAGLMRYHSAPSSTFATLLESDFYSANDSAELVQLLANNGLHDAASFGNGGLPLKPHHKQPSSINEGQPQQVYSGQTDVVLRHGGRGAVVFEDRIGQGPLSAILEHAGEETCVSQPCQENSIAGNSNSAVADRDNQYKSNLIRQSSLPTDFLSRLALSGLSENPAASQQVGSFMQSSSQQVTSHLQSTAPRTADNTGGKVYVVTSRMSPKGVPVRKCLADDGVPCTEGEFGALDSGVNHECSLSRQNSSPAGLLSQLTLDEFANPAEKAVKPSQTFVLGGWDEASMDFAMQKIAAMGQRKRGREIDARLTKILPATDLMMDQITTSPRSHYPVLGASNGDVTDAVLCKSRAKRGCATHPRSIAERVRRTKITERIKKLQDLVPNLDKQAHTADMLDEVVEYVKLLQQRVEELSNQSHVCNGTCQNKGNNPVKT